MQHVAWHAPRCCIALYRRRDADRLQAAVQSLQQLAAAQPQQPQVSGTVCDVSSTADVDQLQTFVADAFRFGPVHR